MTELDGRHHDWLVLALAAAAGTLLGLCVLLTARIYSPRATELMLEACEVNQPLPPFEAVDLNGRRWTAQDLTGRPHMLFFGDTDCPLCKDFYPELRRVQHDVPIVFVGYGDRNALAEVGETQQFVFPILYDSLHVLSTALGIHTVPSVVLVDSGGVVTHRSGSGGVAAALLAYAPLVVEGPSESP